MEDNVGKCAETYVLYNPVGLEIRGLGYIIKIKSIKSSQSAGRNPPAV